MQSPRAPPRQAPHRGLRLAAATCAGLLSSAGASLAAADERVRLTPSVRSLSIPAGDFSLEQRSIGAGVAIEPTDWIAFETGLERSTTELAARDLDVRPFEVQTRLAVENRWGFFHALEIRTHDFGRARLAWFGEMRWMPGSARAQIRGVVLDPLGLDLSVFGRLADLLGARLAWWQTAMGARAAIGWGPLDVWIDGGATWVHLWLRYGLTSDGRALGAAMAGGDVDARGVFVVDEAQPFARGGVRIALPGPFELRGTAGAVPTRRGLASAAFAGLSWVIE